MFTVEGEGCEVPEDEEEVNLIEKFIEHVKVSKLAFMQKIIRIKLFARVLYFGNIFVGFLGKESNSL